MNDNADLLPNLAHEDAFEMQMRGYSRRQVDEFIARCRSQIRDLEQRLARALDESEELRRDLTTAHQEALGAKPAHEEVSERISQILKLADDEARSQKSKAHEEIARQRNDAQQEAEKSRAEAREQAERMLDRGPGAGRAGHHLRAGRGGEDGQRRPGRGRAAPPPTRKKKSEAALARAKAQAKKALDEATARATAIHDGAERRLNLLSTRHNETLKRLTDILDGVSGTGRGRECAAQPGGRGGPGHGQDHRRQAASGGPRPADQSSGPDRERPAGAATPGGPRPGASARAGRGAPSRPATQSRPVQHQPVQHQPLQIRPIPGPSRARRGPPQRRSCGPSPARPRSWTPTSRPRACGSCPSSDN